MTDQERALACLHGDIQGLVPDRKLTELNRRLDKITHIYEAKIAELEKECVNAKNYMVELSKTTSEATSKIAELEGLINSQIFPSMGDGFSGDYVNGYEKALSDMSKALKHQQPTEE